MRSEHTTEINHNCYSKQVFFNKHPECRYNFLPTLETSVSSYNINSRKMNILGVSDRINGAKLYRIIHVDISEYFRIFQQFFSWTIASKGERYNEVIPM